MGIAEAGEFVEPRGRRRLVDAADAEGLPREHRLICVDDDASGETISVCLHACPLVPETSCEARNGRLDRNLLVPTLTGAPVALLATAP